eukprot:COSAG05_NODE_3440_length_2062_cov_1.560367_1_plen_99_part_00
MNRRRAAFLALPLLPQVWVKWSLSVGNDELVYVPPAGVVHVAMPLVLGARRRCQTRTDGRCGTQRDACAKEAAVGGSSPDSYSCAYQTSEIALLASVA